MARNGRSLQDLAAEIERRAEAKQDFIAPVGKLSMEVVDDKPALALQNGALHTYAVNSVAHRQIAEFAGIPKPYYDRMATEDPQLLATNVNRWFRDQAGKGARRNVRMLDGVNRAFLSDSYRTLENEDLAEAVLPVLLDMNLILISCEITDTRLYLKAVDKNIQRDIPTGHAMGDGTHTIFDTVSPAIIVSNSEVGFGRLSVEWGVWTWACTNLASFGASFKKAHLGGRADMSDDVYALLTDDTKKKTDAAVWSQVRDVVRGAFEAARFEATVKKLGQAAGDQIEPERAVEVIERVGRKFSFNEGERKGILGRLIKDGDLTRYGLHAAITRYSQDEVLAYDRSSEMERIGGEVIDLAPGDWRVLAAA